MQKIFLAVLLSIICSCAPQQKIPGYWDLPTSKSKPSTEKELNEECLRIRNAIVTENTKYNLTASRGSAGAMPKTSNTLSILVADKHAKNIAALENRSAAIGCPGAFSSTIVKEPGKMLFDECYKKCMELTDRTKTECFDSCNK
jgi:hypothetical protein